MPFKYVDDDKTAILLDDNKLPIWQHEDGKEVGVNFGGTLGTIRDQQDKIKSYKDQLSEIESKFKPFNGLNPEHIQQGLEIKTRLDEGKLVDSGKRDEAIQKAIEAKDAEWKAKHQSVESAFNEAKQNLESKDATIFNLMVSQKFTQSEYLNKNTTMTPDLAALRFGHNYKIENVDGKLKPVAYLNGEKVYSHKNPGKIADFNESFQTLWENYEYKNNYMKDIPGGSGSQGGHNTNSGNGRDVVLRGGDATNPIAYKAAKELAAKQGGHVILQT